MNMITRSDWDMEVVGGYARWGTAGGETHVAMVESPQSMPIVQAKICYIMPI